MLLSEALVAYSRSLSARGLSASTRKGRLQPLSIAAAQWGDIELASITDDLVNDLFTANAWSDSTRNQYVSALRGFFDWCTAKKHLPADTSLLFGWGNRKVEQTEKLRLPVSEFMPLLDACDHPRDRAICAVGLFCFLRGSELQSLKVRDYSVGLGTLTVYRHKTRETDVMPVCEELRVELRRWCAWLVQDQGTLKPDWFLLPSKKPPTTTSSATPSVRPLQRIGHPYTPAQRALAKLGYPVEGEGEHTLRRSGARALFDELCTQSVDGALLRVASMLGHKDVKVTAKYIGYAAERENRNSSLVNLPMFPSLIMNADIDLEMQKEAPFTGATLPSGLSMGSE